MNTCAGRARPRCGSAVCERRRRRAAPGRTRWSWRARRSGGRRGGSRCGAAYTAHPGPRARSRRPPVRTVQLRRSRREPLPRRRPRRGHRRDDRPPTDPVLTLDSPTRQPARTSRRIATYSSTFDGVIGVPSGQQGTPCSHPRKSPAGRASWPAPAAQGPRSQTPPAAARRSAAATVKLSTSTNHPSAVPECRPRETTNGRSSALTTGWRTGRSHRTTRAAPRSRSRGAPP